MLQRISNTLSYRLNGEKWDRDMNEYKIYNLSTVNNVYCMTIYAKSERDALNQYRKSLTSSGKYWIEKCLNYWGLYSSFGGHWVAEIVK